MKFFDFLRGFGTEKPKTSAEPHKQTTEIRTSLIEEADWNHISCPYCFEQFSHKQVHFRSTTVKDIIPTEEALEERFGDDEARFEHEMNKAKTMRKFTRRNEDQELAEFWEDRFNVKIDQRKQDRWDYPVIRPDDYSMLYHNSEDGLVYTDGFLCRVKDAFSGISTDRLCPKCHNRLSPSYGKYKTIFISVVGITGSGKTVYLNQLLEGLKEYLSIAGLVAISSFNMREQDLIRKNGFLPASTQEGVMQDPKMVDLVATHENGEKETITLVFYDIAGENCMDQNRLYKFGPYLEKSKAIIMMMDPKQFPELSGEVGYNSVNELIETLGDFYEVSGRPKSERPYMAATLSKSDKLKHLTHGFMMEGLVNENSAIFRNVHKDNEKKGFYLQSYQEIKAAMISLFKTLDPNDIISGPLRELFQEYSYFAVSSLGGEVQPLYNIGTDEKPVYVELGVDAEEAIKQLIYGTGTPELFKGEEKVFIGDHPFENTEVIWTFDQIRRHQKEVEYIIVENPTPYRIEQPLLWILYKLGIISGVDA